MKKIILYILIAIFAISLNTSCKKNRHADIPEPNPSDQLPPYTEVGANTFGCLIDGEPFITKETLFGPHNFKIWNGFVTDMGYRFSLGAKITEQLNYNRIAIYINGSNHYLEEGKIYSINSHVNNQIGTDSTFSARITYGFPVTEEYYTDGIKYNGEIHIKKLDRDKKIISGTFWFDAVDTATGQVRRVREGRFDY